VHCVRKRQRLCCPARRGTAAAGGMAGRGHEPAVRRTDREARVFARSVTQDAPSSLPEAQRAGRGAARCGRQRSDRKDRRVAGIVPKLGPRYVTWRPAIDLWTASKLIQAAEWRDRRDAWLRERFFRGATARIDSHLPRRLDYRRIRGANCRAMIAPLPYALPHSMIDRIVGIGSSLSGRASQRRRDRFP
jgi:hypothetical protein